MLKQQLNIAYKTARKIVIAVVGVTIVIVGIALIITPGPAMLVIPAGLAILGLEFAWARRWLKKLRQHAAAVVNKAQGSAEKNNNES